MTNNERLFRQAREAISRLFNDQTVDAARARENLQALRDEIDILIDTLPK